MASKNTVAEAFAKPAVTIDLISHVGLRPSRVLTIVKVSLTSNNRPNQSCGIETNNTFHIRQIFNFVTIDLISHVGLRLYVVL